MDDLGIETPRLADLRQLLIDRGVKACIESGRWEKLEPGQSLDGFAHEFLGRGNGDVILGRIWSSRDGKGRAAYPMIVCAQIRGLTLQAALALVRPALESLQRRCEAATTAAQIVDALQVARESLRAGAASLETPRTDLQLEGDVPARLAQHPVLGPDRQGFYRVMYQMDRELTPFLRSPGGSRSRGGERLSRQLRVPRLDDDPAADLVTWMTLVYLRIEPWCPVMLISPVGQRWIDVLVGDLAGPELWCLRASGKSLPPASDIPYTLDAPTIARFDQFIAEASAMTLEPLRRSGGEASTATVMASVGGAPGWHPRSRKHAILIALLLAVLLIGSLLFLMLGGGDEKPGSSVPGQGTPPAGAGIIVFPPSPALAMFTLPRRERFQPPAAQETVSKSVIDSRAALRARDRIVADSDNINTFWRMQRDLLLAQYGASADAELLDHAKRIQQALTTLDRTAPLSVPVPAGGGEAGGANRAWAEKLSTHLRRKREFRFVQAFSPWADSLMDPAIDAVRADLAAAVHDVSAYAATLSKLVTAASAAEQRMQSGEAPGELTVLLEADSTLKDVDLRELLAPITERARRVVRIERTKDVQVLLEALGSIVTPPAQGETVVPPPPEVVVAAWRRLGTLTRAGAALVGGGGRSANVWPSTPEELATDSRIADAVREIARTAPDRTRGDALAAEVASEQIRRTRRMLEVVDDDAPFDAAASALTRLNVPVGDLEPRMQFNLLLHALRHELEKAGADEPAVAAAQRFVDSARALPGGAAFIADAAATVKAVETVLTTPPPPMSDPSDPAALGPAATGRYTGKVVGTRLVFTPVAGGAPLDFVRLSPPASPDAAGHSFYLGTTEVSLNMFKDIVSAAAPQIPAAGILAEFESDADARLGPRTWEWLGGGGVGGGPNAGTLADLVPARQWLSVIDANVSAQYAPDAQPGRPTGDHPMNYISPHAAAIVCVLAGCRLPTPAEWSVAMTTLDATAPLTVDNLRDQSWESHRRHVAAAIARGLNLQPADEGSIGPRGGTSVAADDGVLWLAPVATDRRGPSVSGTQPNLKHLRGNVAEWLLNAPDNATPRTLNGPDAEAFLNKYSQESYVAGGSALSDPDPAAAEPRKIDLGESAAGFCDVGFRLAFSIPDGQPRVWTQRERLKTAVKVPYLRGRDR